jgi:hypothetical protein
MLAYLVPFVREESDIGIRTKQSLRNYSDCERCFRVPISNDSLFVDLG